MTDSWNIRYLTLSTKTMIMLFKDNFLLLRPFFMKTNEEQRYLTFSLLKRELLTLFKDRKKWWRSFFFLFTYSQLKLLPLCLLTGQRLIGRYVRILFSFICFFYQTFIENNLINHPDCGNRKLTTICKILACLVVLFVDC